jgi:hypothetical protein
VVVEEGFLGVKNILTYSNGWGHLVMSVAVLAAGMYLVVSQKDATYIATGFTMMGTVVAAWFVPGAAKQVAHQFEQQVTTPASQAAANSTAASSAATRTAAAAVSTAAAAVKSAADTLQSNSGTLPAVASQPAPAPVVPDQPLPVPGQKMGG